MSDRHVDWLIYLMIAGLWVTLLVSFVAYLLGALR